MSEHTKEPWFVKKCSVSSFDIQHDHGVNQLEQIANAITESNARRIVACVNLLEGHDTEQIEGKTLEQYVGEQAFISGITVHEGFNVELNGLACQMFASAFAGQFKGSGAVNYLELGANHPEIGNFTVTIQRNEGKTPHQFRLAAEQQRDELLAALIEAKKEMPSINSLPKTPTRIREVVEMVDAAIANSTAQGTL